MSQSICPACGSSEHDGWINRDGCPEDWSTVQRDSFKHRRWLQLTNEQVIAEARSRVPFDLVWQCTCGRASHKDQGEWFHSDDKTPVCVERLEVAALQSCPDCSQRRSAMRSAVRQIEMFMEDGVRERLTVALAVLDIAIEERQ